MMVAGITTGVKHRTRATTVIGSVLGSAAPSDTSPVAGSTSTSPRPDDDALLSYSAASSGVTDGRLRRTVSLL